MKLAISDEGERTTADAGPVIRSSDAAGLVASTKAGNANGFDELFMRHEARIFRIALRITRNHEDAHCHQRSPNVTAQKSRPAGNIDRRFDRE